MDHFLKTVQIEARDVKERASFKSKIITAIIECHVNNNMDNKMVYHFYQEKWKLTSVRSLLIVSMIKKTVAYMKNFKKA